VTAGGPYRGGATTRWVCIVCYRHIAEHGGLCPTCNVDLLSLDEAPVRAELKEEAERRLQKKMYGEYFGLSLLGFALMVPLLPFIGSIPFVAAGGAVGFTLVRAWTRLRPRSALGLYAERRRRLGAELAGHPEPKALPPHEGDEDVDPQTLDLEATLRWLGLEEKKKR
jgi:hypothetical protein